MAPEKDVRLPFDGQPHPETDAPSSDFWEDIAETLDKIERNTRGSGLRASAQAAPAMQQAPSSPGRHSAQASSQPSQTEARANPAPPPVKPRTALAPAKPVGRTPEADKKTLPRKQAEKAATRQRDSRGRFVGDSERRQLKLAEEGQALAEQQAAKAKKRHDELIKAIKASRPQTDLPGIGDLVDFFRGRRRKHGDAPDTRRAHGNAPDSRRPHNTNAGGRPQTGTRPPAPGGGTAPGQAPRAPTTGTPRGAAPQVNARAPQTGSERRMAAPDARAPHGGIPQTSARMPNGGMPETHGRGGKAGLLLDAAAFLGGQALFMSMSGGGQSTSDTVRDALDMASDGLDVAETFTGGGEAAAQKTAAKTAEGGARTAAKTAETGTKAATQGGKADAKAAEKAAEKSAEKAALKVGTKVAVQAGARGALASAELIPLAGQILAAGMAVWDGVEGWNDAEMHKEAFGLKEGEEATTGQKFAAAMTNVGDMGGLISGGLNLLGFDVTTADLARITYAQHQLVGDIFSSITGFVGDAATGMFDGVKGFFGFGGKNDKTDKDEKTQAAAKQPEDKEKALAGAADKPAGEKKNTGAAATEKPVQDKENASTASTAIGSDKIPLLFEDLAAALTDLGEKIEEQTKQAASTDNGGVFNIFGGGGYGGSGGYSGGGGYSSVSYAGSGGYSGGSAGGGGGGRVAFANNPDSKIGDTIAHEESGTEGVHKIGYDGTGGTSYGKWQLSSKTGSYEEWLRELEKKGGKHSEIASQLRAAGPANTGSRSGHHVDVYKKLAAENEQLFEESQRESLLKHNYNPAMKNLRSDSLRQMINNDKSLQEMMFSTSVQHGGGGAAKIFNRVYREGMSREDLINSVYGARGGQFGSSTAQIQNSVKKRFQRERDLIMGMERGETSAAQALPGNPLAGASQAHPINPAYGNQTQALKYDSSSAGVRLKADGKTVDLSTVRGVDSLKLQRGVNIDKMHPEAVARMASAAADYEKLTGQKLEISEGYRDYAEQVRVKKKYGADAATPGKSTHGTGNTFDIAKSKIVEVENRLKAAGVNPVKFFEEHGLKRTAYRPGASRKHDESWHFEAEDLRTAEMQRDRASFKSGQKTGAEYLTAEQRARYMAPVSQPATALAENRIEENQTAGQQGKPEAATASQIEDKPQPVRVASAETQTAAKAEPVEQPANTAAVMAEASKSMEDASLATQQAAREIPEATRQLANAEPASPQPAQKASGPVQKLMDKAQAAMSLAKSPQALIDNFLPEKARPLVANIQKTAGEILPLTESVSSLLPGSMGSLLSGAQDILGRIAQPQLPSLPEPAQLFGQPLQAANVMQAMPQMSAKLSDPAALLPTGLFQQTAFDTGKLENIMSELLDVTKKNTRDTEKDTEEQNSANIPMEFDDAYCFRFAHDMA